MFYLLQMLLSHSNQTNLTDFQIMLYAGLQSLFFLWFKKFFHQTFNVFLKCFYQFTFGTHIILGCECILCINLANQNSVSLCYSLLLLDAIFLTILSTLLCFYVLFATSTIFIIFEVSYQNEFKTEKLSFCWAICNFIQ